jgi:hypothetical protein
MYVMYMPMIRKQLYITQGQDEALKERARELGVSEAELARRALSEFLSERSPTALRRPKALQSLLEQTRALSEKHGLPSGYRFDRDDLYSGRLRRQSRSDD